MNAIALAAALAVAQAAPAPKLLTYPEAVKEAQARNLDLKALAARLEASQTLAWQAWSNYLPTVTAGASYTRYSAASSFDLPVAYGVQVDPATGAGATTDVLATVHAELQKKDQLGLQLSARQALFVPAAWFGISAAKAGERQAFESVEYGRREVLFGVTRLYYLAVGLKFNVQITEKQVQITRDHEKDARIRYEAGATPKVGFLRAEIDRSKAEQDLKAAQANYDSARVALATLLDRKEDDFDVSVPEEVAPPARGADLEAAAERDRYDVKAARSAIEVAEATRKIDWSGYLPSVAAFANWQAANVSGFSGSDTSWNVGIGLSWTLLDGTLREAKLAESRALLAEADVNWRNAQAKARQEVQTARLELEAALANREKAKETVALAQESQRLTEVNYKAGAATYLEVADANNQLFQAEQANIAEQVKARLALVQLLKAAGQFNP